MMGLTTPRSRWRCQIQSKRKFTMLNVKNVEELEFGPMFCETFGVLFDSLVAAHPKICDIPEGTEVLGDLVRMAIRATRFEHKTSVAWAEAAHFWLQSTCPIPSRSLGGSEMV
jgi:hypothetical protein